MHSVGQRAPAGDGWSRGARSGLGGVQHGTVEPFGRSVLGQHVGRLERLEDERWIVGRAVGALIVAQVLATQHPLLRDDGQQRRIEERSELAEGVVLGDDLGQWPEPEAHDTGLEHAGRDRCGSVERGPVGRVARGSPQLPAGLLGRIEACCSQMDEPVPVVHGSQPVHLADEPVEITEREQVPEGVAQGVTVSTRSTMKTSVSPGPITLPAPRSP